LAGADVRRRGGQVVEGEVHFAGQQGQLGGCATTVGDVNDVDTGLAAEQFAGQVAAAAVTAGTIVQHAGVVLAVLDQVLHAVDVELVGQLGVHDQDVGHVHHERDGFEVFGGVERQVAKQPRVHGMRGQRGHAHGLAIRSGLGHV